MKEEERSGDKQEDNKEPELEKTLMYDSGDKLSQGNKPQAPEPAGQAKSSEENSPMQSKGERGKPDDVLLGRTISDPGSETGSLNPAPVQGELSTSTDDVVQLGHVFAGRFSVEALLGEGGMGRVYLASDRQVNGRKVALKVLLADLSEDPRFRSLFFQEIDAATSFVSEHVVQVRDTGQLDDGMLFLTMDYIEGEALDSVMRREGTFATRHALEVVRQILLGLGSGHAKGYVHRDLKPGNVMLVARTPKTERNPHGVNARILDFGISGLAAELDHKKLMGTPAYMSPEQHLGEAVDLRSDLFSVGVILYELLTGERPFQGKTLKELTTSVLELDIAANLEQFEEIPKSVRGFLQKALAKKRDQRFQNAADFIQAIERSSVYRAKGRTPALINVVAVLAVLAAVGEGAFLVSSEFRSVKAQGDELQTQNLINAAVAAARKERTNELNGEFEVERQRYNREVASLTEAGEKRQERINALESTELTLKEDIRAAKEKAEEQERMLREKDASIRLATEKSTADQSTIAVLTAEKNGLKTKLLAFEYESREEVKAAVAFDDVTSFLGQGNYSGASRRLKMALASSDSMLQFGLANTVDRGGGVLNELVDGFRAVDNFVSSDGADAELLADARQSLEFLKERVPTFANVAGSWIGFSIKEGTEEDVPDRQSIAEGLVVLLEQELQAAQQGLESRHDEKRRELLENPLTCDPVGAIEHQVVYDCEHASDVLSKYAGELKRQLVRENGRLDRASLESFPNLKQWGRELTADPAKLPWLDPDARDTVIEFARARMWYLEGQELDYPMPVPSDPSTLAAEPRRAWHELLTIQQELFDSQGNKCPFLRVDQAFYRVPGTRGQNSLWRLRGRGSLSKSGETREWGLNRAVLGASSGAKRSDLAITGTEIRQAGKVLFDLASLDGAELAQWTGPKMNIDELQSDPSLPGKTELKRFASSLAENPLNCLVMRTNGKTYWISPELGLVLRERDGKALQELIYFERR